ncbi:MAG: ankyrin repeat domain-containing protein [Endozoicomonas sp.]|uniref:ankyrin repeat domain-containing protein n=1 Tax=Endozoicomonas sp. TaxID=1892382 RepID=UPI003D9B9BB2
MRYAILFSWFIGLAAFDQQVQASASEYPEQTTPATSESLDQSQAAQQLMDFFFAAARTNDTEVISTFLEAGFPVNVLNHKGYSALMVATYNGQPDVFNLLLSEGADPCLQDNRGNTALMAAIFRGELKMAYRLMKSECDTQQQNNAGQTAEEFARVFGQEKILEKILTDKKPL